VTGWGRKTTQVGPGETAPSSAGGILTHGGKGDNPKKRVPSDQQKNIARSNAGVFDWKE